MKDGMLVTRRSQYHFYKTREDMNTNHFFIEVPVGEEEEDTILCLVVVIRDSISCK